MNTSEWQFTRQLALHFYTSVIFLYTRATWGSQCYVTLITLDSCTLSTLPRSTIYFLKLYLSQHLHGQIHAAHSRRVVMIPNTLYTGSVSNSQWSHTVQHFSSWSDQVSHVTCFSSCICIYTQSYMSMLNTIWCHSDLMVISWNIHVKILVRVWMDAWSMLRVDPCHTWARSGPHVAHTSCSATHITNRVQHPQTPICLGAKQTPANVPLKKWKYSSPASSPSAGPFGLLHDFDMRKGWCLQFSNDSILTCDISLKPRGPNQNSLEIGKTGHSDKCWSNMDSRVLPHWVICAWILTNITDMSGSSSLSYKKDHFLSVVSLRFPEKVREHECLVSENKQL